MKLNNNFTCSLDHSKAEELKKLLEDRGFLFKTAPYAMFSASGKDVNVTYYLSGKLVVQGKGTAEFVEFILEPEILKEAKLGYESVYDESYFDPRLGIDESGKGDFFGPLCIAGVYVNEKIIKYWQGSGIRDSKRIHSDRTIIELANYIKSTDGCFYSVVKIGNEAYNRLYEKMNNVNSILAWGHARVIENLMMESAKLIPPPKKAISDQFAHNKEVLSSVIMTYGKQIDLVQLHKAEADPAVAAASILAREAFINGLSRLQKQFGMAFPPGASDLVENVAKEFVARFGFEKLRLVAKLHFKTTKKIKADKEIQSLDLLPPETES